MSNRLFEDTALVAGSTVNRVLTTNKHLNQEIDILRKELCGLHHMTGPAQMLARKIAEETHLKYRHLFGSLYIKQD